MKDDEIKQKYFLYLDKMANAKDSFYELDLYKERYTTFEFNFKKQLCKDMYTEAYFDLKSLKQRVTKITLIELWCLKCLKNLQKKKQ